MPRGWGCTIGRAGDEALPSQYTKGIQGPSVKDAQGMKRWQGILKGQDPAGSDAVAQLEKSEGVHEWKESSRAQPGSFVSPAMKSTSGAIRRTATSFCRKAREAWKTSSPRSTS